MHQDNMVVTVRTNGRLLREKNGHDTVYLPFGAEYSLHFKNLESRDAVVSVSIDGQDVLDGNRLVIPTNQEVPLLGFMRGSQVTHAFKFIQKTSQISEHRGDRSDDGIIRVEYRYAKPKPVTIEHHHIHRRDDYLGGFRSKGLNDGNSPMRSFNASFDTLGSRGIDSIPTASASLETMSLKGDVGASSDILKKKLNDNPLDEGITTKGSNQYQGFRYASVGPLEENSHVMVIHVRGQIDGQGGYKEVETPITVETKLKCSVCGTVSPSSANFCPQCSTNLH